jgi:Trp operon repressor
MNESVKLGMEYNIGKVCKADDKCPFNYSRVITGPIELAIVFGFLEFLVEDCLKGQKVLLTSFRVAVLHKNNKFFDKISIELQPNEKSCFKAFIEELKNIVDKEQIQGYLSSMDKKVGVAGSYQVEELISFLNSNPTIYSTLLRITEGKSCSQIVEMLGVSITLLTPGSYYIKNEFKSTASIFTSEQTIYVSHDDNKQSTLYYTRNNKEFIPIPKAKPVQKAVFELPCGHLFNRRFDTPLKLREANPNANLVLKCPDKNCYYVISKVDAKKYLGDDYDTYYNVKELNETACIFDGRIVSNSIKVDSQHYICIKCMNCYLDYIKKKKFTYFDKEKNLNALKCPVPECKSTFTFKNFYSALPKKEIETIRARYNDNGPKKSLKKHCPLCKKEAKKEDKGVIEHECNTLYHKICLMEYVDKSYLTQGLHEIFCSVCVINFPSEDIAGLFSDSSDCLKRLKKNMEEKAVTLTCPFCGVLSQTLDYNNPTRKCKCGKSFCRYCRGHPGDKCFPRYKVIEDLLESYKFVFPCPRCLQFNVTQTKTMVTACVNCKARMCGECGADQDVIKYHGSKYHRPGCHNGKSNVNGTFDCPLCKIKECVKPGKLDCGELSKSEMPK